MAALRKPLMEVEKALILRTLKATAGAQAEAARRLGISRSDLAYKMAKSEAAIEGAVQRLRPKLMTVSAVLASLIPILWESGIGSDVMKPIAAPIVGGMITSTVHVLILVPMFFALMKEWALKHGTLKASHEREPED